MKTHRKQKNKAGFTLIELLLVMAILAILSAVVIPKFAGHSQTAKIAAAKSDISNLGTSIEMFEVNCGRFPTNLEGLEALEKPPINVQDEWQGPYLKLNVDPWKNEYNYKQPGQYNTYSYDVWSNGPDGISGNEDDICNWTEDDMK
jgi:general secretion pathway protein G